MRAVDMGNDLEQEVRHLERGFDGGEIGRLVLVPHGAGGDAHGAVIERAHHHVDLGAETGIGQLLGKAPELASAGDRRVVVQEHAMGVAALAPAERDRDDLAGLGVVAEAGRIRHADELVFDDGLVHLERLRHQRAQLLEVGPIGDDHIFALPEAIGSRRIGGAGERHGKGALTHVGFFHETSFGWARRGARELAARIGKREK
jgi:hypothetical protein